MSELAEELEISVSTVTREVHRAEQTGVVVIRPVGRAKVVRADPDNLLTRPLTELLLLAFGPATVVAEELSDIDDIEEAYIFGSWAARYMGDPGPSPRDLDVLVIGNPNRDVVYAAADRIERRVARPAQLTIRSPAQWNDSGEDPFLREVRQRPLLPIGSFEAGSD